MDCLICGKSFLSNRSQAESGRRKYCSTKCRGIGHGRRFSGKNNPSYKNGETFNDYQYHLIKKARNPGRFKARSEFHNALRRGDIKKMPCEICGVTKKVQGHHDDYSKPLDVRWLCIKHHWELHPKKQQKTLTKEL